MAPARINERSELDLLAIVCLVPSLLYIILMFVYPFLFGLYVSLQPTKGSTWSIKNYVSFFADPYQYATIGTTFALAIPNSILVVLAALFLAYGMRRGIRMERTITTILVLPISLGVIFLSEGILGFYGTNGWLNQMMIGAGLLHEPLELTHNFIGVTLSLFMQQFPFCFLMLLGYISGIDPSLESSARMLGAGPWTVFRRVMLPLIAPGLAIAFALVFVMSCRFPVGGHGRAAGSAHAHDLDRRLSAGVRTIRHVVRFCDRRDHGALPIGGAHRDRAGAAPDDDRDDHGCWETLTGEDDARPHVEIGDLYLPARLHSKPAWHCWACRGQRLCEALVQPSPAARLHDRLVRLCLD
jgi:putative spermidine/putrescine transport system permease protein